jgi:hypothetical protein
MTVETVDYNGYRLEIVPVAAPTIFLRRECAAAAPL